MLGSPIKRYSKKGFFPVSFEQFLRTFKEYFPRILTLLRLVKCSHILE